MYILNVRRTVYLTIFFQINSLRVKKKIFQFRYKCNACIDSISLSKYTYLFKIYRHCKNRCLESCQLRILITIIPHMVYHRFVNELHELWEHFLERNGFCIIFCRL